MSEWIEINLPFYVDSVSLDTKLPKHPNLKRKAKKQLGMTLEENEKTLLTGDEDFWCNGKIWKEFEEKDNKIKTKLHKKNLNYEIFKAERWKQLEDLAKKDEVVNIVVKFLSFKKKYEEWLNEQPEIIKYDEEYERIIAEEKDRTSKMSFVGMGLNKAGTLIEVESGDETSQYLIGDINKLQGVCDDCMAFDANAIVKRYKIVWIPELEATNIK